jgi:hypothetical protein
MRFEAEGNDNLTQDRLYACHTLKSRFSHQWLWEHDVGTGSGSMTHLEQSTAEPLPVFDWSYFYKLLM